MKSELVKSKVKVSAKPNICRSIVDYFLVFELRRSLTLVISTLWFINSQVFAQDSSSSTFTTFVGQYRSVILAPSLVYGQQYTHWPKKHIGISIASYRANQENIADNQAFVNRDLNELAKVRQENHRYWDAAFMTRLTAQKQQLVVGLGISADKLFTSQFEKKTSQIPYFKGDYLGATSTITTSLKPHIQASYSVNLSPKFSFGLHTRQYFGKTHAVVYGLSANYHFNLIPDSLGLSLHSKTTWGMLGGAAFTGNFIPEIGEYRLIRPYLGVFVEKKMGINWLARIEASYARRASAARQVEMGSTTYLAGNYEGNYIQIPLLLQYEFAYKWYFMAGPQFSILLNGTYQNDFETQQYSSAVLLGFATGIGYDISERLSIETRYQFDLIGFTANPYGQLMSDFRLGLRHRFSRNH